MANVLTGLDRFREAYWKELKGCRLGLLANQASLDRHLDPAKDVIVHRLPGHLQALFGPQHGYGGEEQDNMVETDHARDPELDIPIFSLYGVTREPQVHMFEHIDLLLVDLQDVGTRVYTFAATMLNCLKAAAQCGKKVLVLDRPNPLGGEVVEGNVLKEGFQSFVGPYRLPMRHGLTMGELARLFNAGLKLGCDLDVLPMIGWHRHMLWKDTGLRWILPSPNMPLPETAYVYPGQVVWEGTNVSEGRGTCRPFEIFGAPYFDRDAVLGALEKGSMEGCILQKYTFRPTFQKWTGRICHGFMIHVNDFRAFRPYATSLALLRAVTAAHPDHFRWRDPPYEYEFEKRPIDLILGDRSLRHEIEHGTPIAVLMRQWQDDLSAFMEETKPHLLY